jgi:porin
MKRSFRRAPMCLTLLAACTAGAGARAAAEPEGAVMAQAGAPAAAPSGPAPPGLPPGPLTPLGDSLRERGLQLGLVFVNLNVHNPSTGINEGRSANFGQFVVKAGLDLERLVGLPNTQINLIEVWQKPSHNTDAYLFDTGSGFTPFPVVKESSNLANLTITHRLLDDRLRIEYGRMNLTWDFMLTSMCSGCIISAPAS